MIGEPAVRFATPLARSPGILACSTGRACWRCREDAPWPCCALAAEGPRGTPEWIDDEERFWTESLDRLAGHLAELYEEGDTSDDDTTDLD
jgi:hypothetical protein